MKSISTLFSIYLILTACATTKPVDNTAAAAAESQQVETAKIDAKADPVEAKEIKAKKAKVKKDNAEAKTLALKAICKGAGEERTLEIMKTKKGCELHYTKGGQTATIASQVIGQLRCEEVMTNLKEKLISSGFTCS